MVGDDTCGLLQEIVNAEKLRHLVGRGSKERHVILKRLAPPTTSELGQLRSQSFCLCSTESVASTSTTCTAGSVPLPVICLNPGASMGQYTSIALGQTCMLCVRTAHPQASEPPAERTYNLRNIIERDLLGNWEE